MTKTSVNIKTEFVQAIRHLQDTICHALENEDGKAKFREDGWYRPGGGGGRTRVIEKGNVFEKGGVNFSEVSGAVTDTMRKQLHIAGEHFFATGLSLVLHPVNPFVPAVHANFRYFELYNESFNVIDSWFGGGMDLTPYYLFEEDAIYFHSTLREVCDRFDKNLYPAFKKNCDEYFVNAHRNNETRGIGGIFFDSLRVNDIHRGAGYFDFVKSCSEAFLSSYIPIVQKRKYKVFDDHHKYWQEIRRGRYVEFNLLHDRGTLFGIKTNGRTESILISLPPTVRFDYNYQPEAGSEEEKLLKVCLSPKEWV
jgi:coproporphyrinogen III oxidase